MQSFEIRNAKTHIGIGWKVKNGTTMVVPLDGEIEDFAVSYNAPNNYDMGLAVELYDVDKQSVDHFAIIYAFKLRDVNSLLGVAYYDVLEATVGNLEMLEIIDVHNKKESQNVDKSIE